ncbi:MAG: hypothetical protein EAZ53_14740 [Bacteroidetes bacterium]|nr:MAG: hypothetical protein EAZ53_14740 [Bacteroidota bacterium]
MLKMETIVIEAKTKKQASLFKAMSDALGTKYRNFDDVEKMEDTSLGKLMQKVETGEILAESAFDDFKNSLLK